MLSESFGGYFSYQKIDWVVWSYFAHFNQSLCQCRHHVFEEIVSQWVRLRFQHLALFGLHFFEASLLRRAISPPNQLMKVFSYPFGAFSLRFSRFRHFLSLPFLFLLRFSLQLDFLAIYGSILHTQVSYSFFCCLSLHFSEFFWRRT